MRAHHDRASIYRLRTTPGISIQAAPATQRHLRELPPVRRIGGDWGRPGSPTGGSENWSQGVDVLLEAEQMCRSLGCLQKTGPVYDPVAGRRDP
jgi:hypothetical protein